MTESPGPRFGLAWDHYRRWFLRGRVFRLAIQVRLLTLASAGVMLTIFGWWGLTKVFANDASLQPLLPAYDACPWKDPSPGWLSFSLPTFSVTDRLTSSAGPNLGDAPDDAVIDPWRRLSVPFRQLFEVSRSFTGATFLLLCCIWAAAVWGFFGGAITRAVVVHLAREEAISLGSASRHALRRWKSYFAAPLFPIIFVMIVAVPAVLIGFLMKLSLLIGGILWPIVILVGLVATILLAGLSVGWPLMHAAVSAEGSDSFDALSRSYSYVYQRPLNYLLYAASAAILGLLGLAVVDLFASAVAQLAVWSVSWGAGNDLTQRALNTAAEHGRVDRWGVNLIWFWNGAIKIVVLGFAFSFFWTASTAIYLLLRHDVDGAEPEEVFLDDAGETYGMPPLTTDAAGVPTVAPESSSDAGSTIPKPPPS